MQGWRLAASGVVFFAATHAHAEPEVVYQLSSPDVGVDWHLHARDGALVCALPCEAPLGEHSGDYVVVHDAKKAWRVDLPSSLPANPGQHVFFAPRVGKGHPALGVFGTVAAATGAAASFAGLALLGVSFFNLVQGCSAMSPAPCSTYETASITAQVGAPMFAGGAMLAMIGLYFAEHNRSASYRLRVSPTSIAGTF